MNKYKGARTAFLKGANNDICRLCLAGRGELSDLFKNEPKETGIRIFHCTQIKLKYIAGLPSAICESCKSELVIASNFRKRCLESDEFLRKVYPHLFEDDMQKPEPKSKIDPQNSLEVQLLDLESFNNYDDNQAQYEILLKEEGVEEVEDVVEEQQEDAGEEDGEEDGEANFKVERRYSREHIFLDRNEEDYANYYDEGSTEGHNENTNEDDEQSRTETEYVTYSRSNYEEDEAEENELNPEQRSDDPQEEEEGDEEVEEEEDHDKEDESDPEFKIPKTQIRKRRKSSVTKGANIGKRRKFNKTDAKNNDQDSDHSNDDDIFDLQKILSEAPISDIECTDNFETTFHVSYEAFVFILQEIYPVLRKRFQRKEKVKIPLRKQLMATLYLLANNDSFRSTGEQFGLSKSSLSMVFFRIIDSLNQISTYIIKWPTKIQMEKSKSFFQEQSKIQNIIGMLHYIYVPVKVPTNFMRNCINAHGFASMTLQAIFNENHEFIDCCVDFPSGMHHSIIFEKSPIHNAIDDNNRRYFPDGEMLVTDNLLVKKNWCLSSNTNSNENMGLTNAQRKLYDQINIIKHIARQSFALFFGRFRRLKKIEMNRVELIPATLRAVCTLHNITLRFPDTINFDKYIEDGTTDMMENLLDSIYPKKLTSQEDGTGIRIRNRRSRKKNIVKLESDN